jgi:hypothetical protein
METTPKPIHELALEQSEQKQIQSNGGEDGMEVRDRREGGKEACRHEGERYRQRGKERQGDWLVNQAMVVLFPSGGQRRAALVGRRI